MVMSYEEARQLEAELREEFGDDVLRADCSGGLPEDPADFNLEEAKQEFKEQQDEDESGSYDGPDPVGDPWIDVDAEVLDDVVDHLKNAEPERYDFDSLHSLGGDHLPESEEMVVIYHLYSHANERWAILKCFVPEAEPVVPSVTDHYRIADWYERETFDMLGIRFTDHPDLRRLLLPEDWVGYPLRKDYAFPSQYRGLPVDWDEGREARMSRDDFYQEALELEEMDDFDEELHFPAPEGNGR